MKTLQHVLLGLRVMLVIAGLVAALVLVPSSASDGGRRTAPFRAGSDQEATRPPSGVISRFAREMNPIALTGPALPAR